MEAKNTLQLNQENFEDLVRRSDRPVLVDFWAPWCPPCRAIAPAIDDLATEYAGRARVGKVDIDENPGLASRFHVHTIPTLIVFEQGRAVRQIVGAVARHQIAALLEQSVPSPEHAL